MASIKDEVRRKIDASDKLSKIKELGHKLGKKTNEDTTEYNQRLHPEAKGGRKYDAVWDGLAGRRKAHERETGKGTKYQFDK